MNRERVIEEAIMNNPGAVGYPDALAIRNIRLAINKRAGLLDVLLLPQSGPHRLVMIETKIGSAPDADGKCVGQLLKYYAFALQLGSHGLEQLNRYAREKSDAARSARRTTPKAILGLPREGDGLATWTGGDGITPAKIALFVAIGGPGHDALPVILDALHRHHRFRIGLLHVDGTSVRRAENMRP